MVFVCILPNGIFRNRLESIVAERIQRFESISPFSLLLY
jgi:hypothetical protein